jgi:hypothetical protein
MRMTPGYKSCAGPGAENAGSTKPASEHGVCLCQDGARSMPLISYFAAPDDPEDVWAIAPGNHFDEEIDRRLTQIFSSIQNHRRISLALQLAHSA